MPKLDGTHLPQRLAERLADLRAGKEVAARDLKALLNNVQIAEMEAAWEEQQLLRKQKRARTKEEEVALGWKTKRDIHIEAYERAVAAANDGLVEEFERLQEQAEIRGAKIYFDTLNQALKDGKDKSVATNLANNAMTRAGLRRMDGQAIGMQGLTKRDREIRAMEDPIQQKAESEMNDYEREQLELLREYEKAVLANRKKRG